MDYKKIGLKCGVEVHVQLNTKKKLFCSCSSRLSRKKPTATIIRKLRPVAGETGEIDKAALYEVFKKQEFQYMVYPDETCLVETDTEPIHPINGEALRIALEIAILLNCEIPDEIHIMRKTVIDGSNTSGFQRTVIVGLNGWVETGFGRVGITNVCLEEDSARIIQRSKNKTIYGLDRLSIPLVEIGTSADASSPKEAKELALALGMVLKSTGKIKRGLGTIRQDLNVSIKGGARVEIKGVQNLNLIPKLVENEVRRQMELIKSGKNVRKEVRKALLNGKTKFLRPLPGSARMYPETDAVPIIIENDVIREIKRKLPELVSDKRKRLVERYRINEEIAKQIINDEKAELFETLSEYYNPKIIASLLTSYLKQLKTEGIPIEKLTDDILKKLFQFLRGRDVPKEKLIDILRKIALNPNIEIKKLIEKSETVSEEEIRKLVKTIIKKKKSVLKRYNAEKILMGLIMKELRKKAPGRVVIKILREEIKKK